MMESFRNIDPITLFNFSLCFCFHSSLPSTKIFPFSWNQNFIIKNNSAPAFPSCHFVTMTTIALVVGFPPIIAIWPPLADLLALTLDYSLVLTIQWTWGQDIAYPCKFSSHNCVNTEFHPVTYRPLIDASDFRTEQNLPSYIRKTVITSTVMTEFLAIPSTSQRTRLLFALTLVGWKVPALSLTTASWATHTRERSLREFPNFCSLKK